MGKKWRGGLVMVLAAGLGLGASRAPAADDKALYSAEELEKIYQLSPVPPVPPDPTNAYANNEKAAGLGKTLFFDKRLSCAGNVSCATCHNPQQGWSDGRALPKVFLDPHITGAKGSSKRRVPSLWNAAYSHWQFWDGRADSLWSQSLGPPENSIEMEGGSRLQYAHAVYDDKDLRGRYEGLFGKMPDLSDAKRFPPKGCPRPGDPQGKDNAAWESMSPADQKAVNRVYANIGKSLEAFERKIVSRNSRFDAYVDGLQNNHPEKLAALTPGEKNGLKLFVGKASCVACHSGPNFTDEGFHDIRVPTKNHSLAEDLGRYDGIATVKASPFNGGGDYSDDQTGDSKQRLDHLKAKPINKRQFKTPGLRNVARFGPYMHQGQFLTLKEVVNYYSTLQGAQKPGGPDEHLLKAIHLSDAEMNDLVSFLGSLTDESANAALVPADMAKE
jgi:cytochrome c peroxidase